MKTIAHVLGSPQEIEVVKVVDFRKDGRVPLPQRWNFSNSQYRQQFHLPFLMVNIPIELLALCGHDLHDGCNRRGTVADDAGEIVRRLFSNESRGNSFIKRFLFKCWTYYAARISLKNPIESQCPFHVPFLLHRICHN